MNLVLIGYRGAGKSAVAAAVAARLGLRVYGMDAEIERRAGRRIPEFVSERGWPAFRDLETEVARDAGRADGLAVDCGGGVIERPENIPALKANGRVFWLRAAVPTIVARIAGGAGRPALTEGRSFTDEVAEVLARRAPLYAAAADETVETDGRPVEELAAEIAARWTAAGRD